MVKKKNKMKQNQIKEAIVSAYNEMNLKNQKESFTDDSLKMIICIPLKLIVFLFIIIGVLIIISVYEMFFSEKIFGFLEKIIVFLIGLSFWGTSNVLAIYLNEICNELKKEKDSQYILAYFNAVIAFLALIISCISLFK